ncbi:MAG: tRNA guanosine(34) transglycosylase Tgt [Elusimicrobia bacterium]|nr:tRNA guanosine(34) transglycosylase Tgt [Elusimicrobiota bacterium]
MAFRVLAQDPSSPARAGVLSTPHGDVETPVFMPVATQGAVKALSQEDLGTLGARAILSNSYHLYLRPGLETVRQAGGLHRFMAYDGMVLTDSGGFQVLSLADLRAVDDEGVTFKSHLDGSEHRLTAESVIEVQQALGSDCWTTLDECPPYPADQAQAAAALRRTMAWSDRSVPALARARDAGARSLLFPILQGSFHPDLRRRAVEHLQSLPWDGVSIGGLSVGEPKDLTWSTLELITSLLPPEKPRYLMGVGTPEDLWEAAARGVDMMDCVWPTRVARNGLAVTRRGRLSISNRACRDDLSPLDPDCACFVCRRYSRAYLCHLFRAKELSVYRLLTYHNLHLMLDIAAAIRRSIREGCFAARRREFLARRAPVEAS